MSILALPSTTEDVIFDHLSAATLVRYAKTSKASHCQVQSYMCRRFRLHELLAPYFSLPQIDYLRQLQAATGMLISGSTALQFFDRVVYPESDLDLYVENGHDFCEKIGGWLLEVGYIYVPCSFSSNTSFIEDLIQIQEDHREISPSAFIESGPDDPAYHARFVFTFSQNLEKGSRKVQIIASEGPPLGSVLNFHSTCVMNILTYDAAYSIFPRATFEDRIGLALLCNKPSRNESALRKYQHRGWTIHQHVSEADLDAPTFLFAPKLRYVGDALCWKIPILPTFHPEQPCCYDIESNSWTMSYNNSLALTMMYEVVASPRLQFSYLIESDENLVERLEIEIDSDSGEYEAEGLRPFLDDQLNGVIDRYRKRAA